MIQWRSGSRLLVVYAVLLSGLSACQQADALGAKPIRLVRVVPVVLEPYAQTAALTGEIEARSKIDLAFRLTGQITEVHVAVGDHVAANQLLARIDSEIQQADIKLAEASVRAAQAALEQATAALSRQQSLLDGRLITRSKYDQAVQDRTTAQSSLDSSLAMRDAANNALSYTELRADAAGVVTRVNRVVDEMSQPAQPVISIAHDGPRDAIFNVYESLLFAAGENVSTASVDVALIADGNIRAIGHVREISPTVDTRTGTVRVTVALQDPPAAMTLHALVTGQVTLSANPAVTIPWSAITFDHGSPSVWLVAPQDHTVMVRHVQIKKFTTGGIILDSGVQAGELLVTEGGQFLYDGKIVRTIGKVVP